jgi:hypothetical protein
MGGGLCWAVEVGGWACTGGLQGFVFAMNPLRFRGRSGDWKPVGRRSVVEKSHFSIATPHDPPGHLVCQGSPSGLARRALQPRRALIPTRTPTHTQAHARSHAPAHQQVMAPQAHLGQPDWPSPAWPVATPAQNNPWKLFRAGFTHISPRFACLATGRDMHRNPRLPLVWPTCAPPARTPLPAGRPGGGAHPQTL